MSREEELKECVNELYQYWLDRAVYDFKVLSIDHAMYFKDKRDLFVTYQEMFDSKRNLKLTFDNNEIGDIHCYTGNLSAHILKPIARKKGMSFNTSSEDFFILEHIQHILRKYNIKTIKMGTDLIKLDFLYQNEPLNPLIVKKHTIK